MVTVRVNGPCGSSVGDGVGVGVAVGVVVTVGVAVGVEVGATVGVGVVVTSQAQPTANRMRINTSGKTRTLFTASFTLLPMLPQFSPQ